jgi:hypothetical protein
VKYEISTVNLPNCWRVHLNHGKAVTIPQIVNAFFVPPDARIHQVAFVDVNTFPSSVVEFKARVAGFPWTIKTPFGVETIVNYWTIFWCTFIDIFAYSGVII